VLAAVVAAEFIQAAAQAYRTIHMQMAARQAVQNFANADAQDREILRNRANSQIRGVRHSFDAGRLYGGGWGPVPPSIINILSAAQIANRMLHGDESYDGGNYRTSVYDAANTSVISLTWILGQSRLQANAIALDLATAYVANGYRRLTHAGSLRGIFSRNGASSYDAVRRRINSAAAPAIIPAAAPAIIPAAVPAIIPTAVPAIILGVLPTIIPAAGPAILPPWVIPIPAPPVIPAPVARHAIPSPAMIAGARGGAFGPYRRPGIVGARASAFAPYNRIPRHIQPLSSSPSPSSSSGEWGVPFANDDSESDEGN